MFLLVFVFNDFYFFTDVLSLVRHHSHIFFSSLEMVAFSSLNILKIADKVFLVNPMSGLPWGPFHSIPCFLFSLQHMDHTFLLLISLLIFLIEIYRHFKSHNATIQTPR